MTNLTQFEPSKEIVENEVKKIIPTSSNVIVSEDNKTIKFILDTIEDLKPDYKIKSKKYATETVEPIDKENTKDNVSGRIFVVLKRV